MFVRDLAASPPPGVAYDLVMDPHASSSHAAAAPLREVLFNRLVHPFLWPLPGLRAYRVGRGVDVAHVHNFPTWLRLPVGVPVVYSVGGSGYPHYLETYLGWSAERIAARYRRARRVYRSLGIRSEVATPEGVDAVVVFSAFAADQLERWGVPPEKVRVIPPGFSIPRPPPPGPRRGPFTFLLVGRHPHRKGADLAVEAARTLVSRGVDARLVLVGDPAYPPMADGRVVEGWGPVPRERLFGDFFRAADAVLVPSRAEGFGFAAVEAMGHGKPVVVARRDALPGIVGAEAGLTAAPGDARDLAEAMEALARDPDRAAALGAAGRARFEAVFHREEVNARWAELYRHVVEEKRGG